MARPQSFVGHLVAMFALPMLPRPRLILLLLAACLATGISACGSKTVSPHVLPTAREQRFATHKADPAVVKALPLGAPAALVRQKLGAPAEIDQRQALVSPKKGAKKVNIHFAVWSYGVKGTAAGSVVELSFQKSRLVAVLTRQPGTKSDAKRQPTAP